jgi:hypothetical protein
MSKVIKVDFNSKKTTKKGVKDVGFGQQDKTFPPNPILIFPTLTEADKIRVDLIGIEKDIKMQLDNLQFLNDDIVDLTIMYEAMLHRLCEITGVEIPSEEYTPPEDELH